MKCTLILNLFILFLIKITLGQQCQKAGIILFGFPVCDTNDYQLVFEDNFGGNSFDHKKWDIIEGVPRDFNFEQQKAWRSANNIEVSNGTLKIIAKKLTTPYIGTWVTDWSTNPPTTKTSTFDYTTGEIWTKLKFFQGIFEIRCRMPEGKGFGPSFWTFGGQRWNEIDVFEIYGDNIDRFTCNVHHDYDGDGQSEYCSYGQDNVTDFTQWHTFTCIFDFDKIIWFIDGNLIRIFYRIITVNGDPVVCGDDIGIGEYIQEKSYPLENMHIIASMAIMSGSNAPDVNTVFPSTFEIDYIRYYKKKDCCNDLTLASISDLNLNPDLDVYNFICGEDIVFDGNITISSGTNVHVVAENSIKLKPGFHAEQGSHFEPKINSALCSSKSLKSASNSDTVDLQRKDANSNTITSIGRDTSYIEIYPNPNQGKFNVIFRGFNSLTGIKIIILDMQGKSIYKKTVSKQNETIDLSNYTNGIYLVHIINENNKTINVYKISIN